MRLSDLRIQPQPDDTTCGPTCLQAVYDYYGLTLPLPEVIQSTQSLAGGGTLAVMLGVDALERGFAARIYTWNLVVFDPTWFRGEAPPLADRLRRQREVKQDARLRQASDAYLAFLERGGQIRFEDLTAVLFRRWLRRGIPLLTGLSATYLYGEAREVSEGARQRPDDVEGEPQGHFVVLCDYDPFARTVLVADPLHPNPLRPSPKYAVPVRRLVCAVMLGVVTYDANLLVVWPRKGGREARRAIPDRRRQP